jgi:hypothetical protein
VRPFAFRVTAQQRAEIEAKACAMGLTPNQYARACALVGLAPTLGVTPTPDRADAAPAARNGNGHAAKAARELRVEYDEVPR